MISDVRDNKARHRFEIDADGTTAFVTYSLANGVLTFLHEKVPPEAAGHGVGSALAKGALDLVRADRLKMVPKCPFMAAYVRKHPEYNDLLA
jgi:hypothetical protein